MLSLVHWRLALQITVIHIANPEGMHTFKRASLSAFKHIGCTTAFLGTSLQKDIHCDNENWIPHGWRQEYLSDWCHYYGIQIDARKTLFLLVVGCQHWGIQIHYHNYAPMMESAKSEVSQHAVVNPMCLNVTNLRLECVHVYPLGIAMINESFCLSGNASACSVH